MQLTIQLSSVLITCILLLGALPAFAHDGVDHGTEADAQAHVEAEASVTTPPPLTRPLDMLKAKAREIQQNTKGAKIELRQDTKVQLQNADRGEKKGILHNAVDARIDIAKDRKASTTDVRGDVKALVRWHGGLIKERFVLAIRHFNNLLGRIDARLGKMQSEGINTETAVKAKVEAQLAVDKAAADAKLVADFVQNVPDGSDRATVRAELNAKIKTAQQSLKAAHRAVQKAVQTLVDLAKSVRPKADVKVESSTNVNSSTE